MDELMIYTVDIESTAPRSLVEHLMLAAIKSIGEQICPGGRGDVTITLSDRDRRLAVLNLTSGATADVTLDRQTWSDQHPCRGCGRLYGEHPTTTECRDWY